MKKLLFSLILLSSPVLAEDWNVGVIGPFGGINNAENSMTIPANMAQDALNVDITDGGRSFKKREGYAQAFATTYTTSAIHGVFAFYDSSGNDVVLAFNDVNVTASVAGGTASTIYSTATAAATWQCVDSQGYAYCVNSERDGLFKTAGVTLQSLAPASTGTIVAVTPERLVQAGFSGTTSNRIDFSKANDFTTWTVGSEPTDPITFTITAPGSKITHLTYAHKKIYWFKESSFGYILEGDELADWAIRVVSSDIGTLDNTSTQDTDGNLYFRGQDGHIYVTDGGSVEKISKDVGGTIATAQGRTLNSWTQTDSTQFDDGDMEPDDSLSYTISSGDVVVSSYSATDDTTAEFNNGTTSSVTVGTNRYSISTNNSGDIADNSFESGGNFDGSGWFTLSIAQGTSCGTVTASDGENVIVAVQPNKAGTVTGYLISADTGATLDSETFSSGACTWVTKTLSSPSNLGKRVRLKFTDSCSGCTTITTTQQDSFILGGDITYDVMRPYNSAQTEGYPMIDNIQQGSSTITSGSYTSAAFNSGYDYGYASISASWTEDDIVPSFVLQQSANGTSGWSDVVSSTGTSAAITDPYLRYISTFTVGTGDALTAVTSVSITARSSGTYYSAVNNAPNLSAWDSFEVTKTDNGGTMTFYVRSATETFTVLSSTPSWTAIDPGETPTVSTGTYFQFKSEFTISHATQNPTLSAFTQNWIEGSASDKSYATFFDDKVMFSVAAGAGQTTNNRILVYDLITPGWTLYDLPSNGFYRRNQSLYFGSSSAGYVYKFGGVDSDNGSAIEAYWKSKDFFMDNPFIDKELVNISVAADAVNSSSVTVTYTTNGETSTSYQIPLQSNKTFSRSNENLPIGTTGGTLNIKIGNDAIDQPFEIFAIQYGWRPKVWKPEP
jgi:hypothetical protein